MPNCWLWQQKKVLELSVYKPRWFIKISTTENKPTFLTLSLTFSLFLCLSVCLFLLPVIHYAWLLEFSTCSFKLLCHQVFVGPGIVSEHTRNVAPYRYQQLYQVGYQPVPVSFGRVRRELPLQSQIIQHLAYNRRQQIFSGFYKDPPSLVKSQPPLKK